MEVREIKILKLFKSSDEEIKARFKDLKQFDN